MSHVAHGDLDILHGKINEIWQDIYTNGTLDSVQFNQLARPYQRRVIKRFLLHHGAEYDFHRVEDIIDFIEGENRKNLSSALMSLERKERKRGFDRALPGDSTLESESARELSDVPQTVSTAQPPQRFLSLYKNRISIVTRQSGSEEMADTFSDVRDIQIQVPEGEDYEPAVYACEPLNLGNVAFEMTRLTAEQAEQPGLLRPLESDELYVDLSDYEGETLTLRTRQPGDRIHPFGMARSMRLKNFFINRGIPRFERDQILLLVDDQDEQDVLWVAGIGLSEKLRVVELPTHVIKIKPITSNAEAVSAGTESVGAES